MLDTNDAAVREAYHRCANDLQLVVSMLQLTANRSLQLETQETLNEIANRIRILARARGELLRKGRPELSTVLREVCEALQAMAEPNGVLIRLSLDGVSPHLPDATTTATGLVVNELITNSLKHAFKDRAKGEITVTVDGATDEWVIVLVDDDGLPFPASLAGDRGERQPLGLDLARRMLAAQGGMLIAPTGDSKCFEIRVPVQSHAAMR